MMRYEWFPLPQIDQERYINSRKLFHLAIQNVAAVGRTYLKSAEEEDGNARLSWVPGLWRMAGQWVEGETSFRSSISFRDHQLLLVDAKINTLGAFDLEGQSYQEAMIWLEQQIIQQQLSSSHLSNALPYELPVDIMNVKTVFDPELLSYGELFGGLFHNAFITFSELQSGFEHSTPVSVYPHHFDMETKLILKKTDELSTDTYIRTGFSPGDEDLQMPYFYINSQPGLNGEKLPKAPEGSYWHDKDWYGLIYEVETLSNQKNQKEVVLDFFKSGILAFKSHLLA